MEPILVAPGRGEPISASPGKQIAILADLPELVAVMNDYAPGASGPDPHVHREHHDCFWVLEGELAFELAGVPTAVPAGGWAAVPPGVAHALSGHPAERAELLNVMAPGGLEQYLKRVATLPGDGPPDPARMAEIASAHDFVPVA